MRKEDVRTLNPPRILIAAAKSGSGKTTLTCALLEALKSRGLSVRAFKCGPDYIDPMFHQKVIGVPSRNLDTFFSDENGVRELFAAGEATCDISVVEGVMGLYDGLGGIKAEGSAYDLACTLKMPVVLIVDAHGMGRSLLPLIAGFLHYDVEKRICGVFFFASFCSSSSISCSVRRRRCSSSAYSFCQISLPGCNSICTCFGTVTCADNRVEETGDHCP